MMTPNDFSDDLDPWNGYRPPMRWWDRLILISIALLSLGCIIGIPAAVYFSFFP